MTYSQIQLFLTEKTNGVFPQPQYLGNKERFVEWILKNTPKANSVLDAFSGSSVVSYYFKKKGYQVYSNDFLSFNYQIAKALIENNSVILELADIETLFSKNHDADTFIQDNYTDIFYTNEECAFLDNLRANINLLDDTKKALAFTATYRMLTRKVLFGYFCHLKAMEYRNHPERVYRNPSINQDMKQLLKLMIEEYNAAVFSNGKENKAFNEDALTATDKCRVDVAYFDPPYVGVHPDYQSNYHFLETFTKYWTEMKLINGTKMYADKKHSGFTSKKEITTSFKRLFEKCEHIPYWVVSYNSRAFPDKDTLTNLMNEFRSVELIEYKYENHVGGMGARKNSHEYLFVCKPRA